MLYGFLPFYYYSLPICWFQEIFYSNERYMSFNRFIGSFLIFPVQISAKREDNSESSNILDTCL